MQRAYTVDEFCLAYRIGRTKAYQQINAGRLRVAKIGSKTIVRADDAEAWLASLASPESSPQHQPPPSNQDRAAA